MSRRTPDTGDTPVPVVRLDGVEHRFGEHVAVTGLDLTIAPGERVALLGASGAGKSTLLSLLNGSITASSGQVRVLGEDLTAIGPARLRATQRRIGTIRQRLDLIDHVRVLHNVNAGRLGRWSTPRALAALAWPRSDATTRSALERVGLGWAAYERTERLSGGERQRVAIARLLVQSPALVLADEPVSSLDPGHAATVLRLLGAPGALAAAGAVTVMVSLHQPSLARDHCTRALGLRDGRIVIDQPAETLDDSALDELYALP